MEYVYTGHRLLITLQWGCLKIRIVIITDSTEACSTVFQIYLACSTVSQIYLGDISYKISSSMKSCLNQIKCGRLNLVFSHDFIRLENMFKFKDRQSKHLQNGVVYKITCSCGKMYIGETGRYLKTRISEHMKTSGTNITEVGLYTWWVFLGACYLQTVCVILLDSLICIGHYKAMHQ